MDTLNLTDIYEEIMVDNRRILNCLSIGLITLKLEQVMCRHYGGNSKKMVHEKMEFCFSVTKDTNNRNIIRFITSGTSVLQIGEKYVSSDCTKWRVKQKSMQSHLPLAVSMMPILNEAGRRELQEYVDHYVSKLIL